MKTISLRLEDVLDRKLTAAAKKRGTTKSEVVRTALDAHLESEDEGLPGSCWALASDLFGSGEGPPDLSTNPKYMRDFGR